jgi:hypothetical protein
MGKIKYIKYIALFGFVFAWLLLIGRGGGSGFFGQINLIDEGQFLAWINQMMNGKLIYRDIYVQYGPLMVLPIYFLFQLFESSVFILKIWQVFDAFVAFAIAFLVLRTLGVSNKLLYFVLISLLIIPGLSFRIWIGVFAIQIAYLAYRKHSGKLYFISGFLLPCFIFYSIEIGLFVLITLMLFFSVNLIITKNLSDNIKKLGLVLAGFLISLAGFVFIFYSQGWFYYYINTTIAFSESIAGNNLPNGMGLPSIPSITDAQNPFTLLKLLVSREMLFYISFFSIFYFLLLSIIGIIYRRDNKLHYLSLLVSFYAMLVFVSIIGRSGHYFAIVPFVVVLGAFFVSQTMSSKEKILGKGLKLIFLILFIAYTARHISIFRFSILSDFKHISFEKIERVYPFFTTKEQANELLALQEFFSKNDAQEKEIYIISNSPGLYFLLNQKNSTKYDLPLLAGHIGRRNDLLNELKGNPPEFIIEDLNAWAVDEVDDTLRMPEVIKFVRKNYKVLEIVGHYKIYRLN